MKLLSQDKCYLKISGHKTKAVWAKIGEKQIWKSREKKLLEADIENHLNDLNFDKFVITLCKKAR